ncbi:MAG: type II toxin-antitoxin system prevent-host-death family antitoxin [Micrococcales bacterium]|nr:type II toxin-antitoxin system prevent-host-death family antitoxin [Micrococcales bacterium]
MIVNVQEAKTRLSELLAAVEAGQDVVIARSGRPIARLTPWLRPPDRVWGTVELVVDDAFFEPLPDAELAAWE